MSEPLTLHLNGQPQRFDLLVSPSNLAAVIAALKLKADRIAVELDGTIVRRTAWPETPVHTNARLEIVHFVGGGAPTSTPDVSGRLQRR